MHTLAQPRYRSRHALALGALLLLAACAALPEPAAPPAPVVKPAAAPTVAEAPTPAGPRAALLEESDAGDDTAFKRPAEPLPTPALAALDAAPPPAPEAVAAVRPSDAAVPADNGEAESVLSHIVPTTPPNVAAAMRLIEDGRKQLAQGRYDQAQDRFERAVAIDPGNAYGYYYLAQLNSLLKKYDQASAFVGRAVTLAARSDQHLLARAYGLQGSVFEDVGRYADARKAYENAVRADPGNTAARVGMARLGGGQ
jgi:tetratricopeptide (TPR) repeat protein